MAEDREPVVAPRGASPARASRPDVALEDERYHIYESNPAPWWMAVVWLGFLIGGAVYLVVNLSR
jgi:hypothetical protein